MLDQNLVYHIDQQIFFIHLSSDEISKALSYPFLSPVATKSEYSKHKLKLVTTFK